MCTCILFAGDLPSTEMQCVSNRQTEKRTEGQTYSDSDRDTIPGVIVEQEESWGIVQGNRIELCAFPACRQTIDISYYLSCRSSLHGSV